ncbi:hypothetical protein LCL96_17880 [Rossellomorea aquimaris]|uniref:hypothetical protein n=1 Tax=Rossellomorea aquimaris TaxID=189382 RepID=UPI001CD4A77A|nr:hypothetical protein [Rossellomorea aquimaris]MCA1060787.1 hypothetical protein [Rossellomorea aquimaris]
MKYLNRILKGINWTFFIIGWLSLLSIVPTFISLGWERHYQSAMEDKYDIFRPNDLTKVSTKQDYHGVQVQTYYKNKSDEIEVNPWGDSVRRGDIFVEVDGEVVTTLKDFDLYQNSEMGAFRSTVEYLLVEENDTGKEQLAIAIETTRQNPRRVGNRMEGMVDDEESSYQVYLINEDGTISENSFTLETKNKLETQLIRHLTYTMHGYHNDDLYMYPSPLLPLQLGIGLLLVIICGGIMMVNRIINNGNTI